MEWISVDEKITPSGRALLVFFEVVGRHRGFYGGLYVDDAGRECPGMEIFYCDYGFFNWGCYSLAP